MLNLEQNYHNASNTFPYQKPLDSLPEDYYYR